MSGNTGVNGWGGNQDKKEQKNQDPFNSSNMSKMMDKSMYNLRICLYLMIPVLIRKWRGEIELWKCKGTIQLRG